MKKNHDSFNRLLQAFKTEYDRDRHSETFGEVLYTLATAITYSVINTTIDPQRRASVKATEEGKTVNTLSTFFNPNLLTIKSSINADLNNINKLQYALNHAYANTRDKNGNEVTVIVNSDLAKSIKKLLSYTIGEGMDIVHECALAILDEAAKHSSDLQAVYTARKLDKRVLIRAENSPKWKEVETTPIQQVFRATSAYVRGSRLNREVATNGYSYIEEVVKDYDGDKLEVIYHRLKKYADLGGYESSSEGLYTLSTDDVDKRNEAVANMGLTKLQVQVLELRESGYGVKSISDRLGVSINSVKSATHEIRRKAKATGLDACANVRPGYVAKIEEGNKKEDRKTSEKIKATETAPTPYSEHVKMWFND